MRSKNLLLSLLSIVAICGCEMPLKFKKQVMKTGNMVLYNIASFQTTVAEKKDSLQYKNGFEVLHTYKLSQTQSDELKAVLTDGKNYSESDSKRCPFMPAYLIEKDTSLLIMISMSPCSKLSFIEEGKETIIDLVNDNGVEKAISRIVVK